MKRKQVIGGLLITLALAGLSTSTSYAQETTPPETEVKVRIKKNMRKDGSLRIIHGASTLDFGTRQLSQGYTNYPLRAVQTESSTKRYVIVEDSRGSGGSQTKVEIPSSDLDPWYLNASLGELVSTKDENLKLEGVKLSWLPALKSYDPTNPEAGGSDYITSGYNRLFSADPNSVWENSDWRDSTAITDFDELENYSVLGEWNDFFPIEYPANHRIELTASDSGLQTGVMYNEQPQGKGGGGSIVTSTEPESIGEYTAMEMRDVQLTLINGTKTEYLGHQFKGKITWSLFNVPGDPGQD